jgi:phage shock protein C
MKRLRKSHEKMLAGVAGGIAEYLDVDPTLVRAGFLIAVFGFGTGFLAYLALALIMPSANSHAE